MNVYIQTDIEGVAGFCFREDRKNPNYEAIRHRHRMYKLLTAEVNAAVRSIHSLAMAEILCIAAGVVCVFFLPKIRSKGETA